VNNKKIKTIGMVIGIVLITFGIYKFIHGHHVITKEVRAVEKNDLYCSNVKVGETLAELLQLTLNMRMAKITVWSAEKSKIVASFEKEVPKDAKGLQTKAGTISVYASPTNSHRFCELKFKDGKITEKMLIGAQE